MRVLFSGICMAFLSASFCSAQQFDRKLSDIAPDGGINGDLSISNIRLAGGRLHAVATISIPDLAADVDQKLKPLGNMGSSRKRLYWAGHTNIDRVGQDCRISASSRARAEFWGYVLGGKTRIFRDTKTIEYSIMPLWVMETKTLSIRANLTNVRNLPNWTEDMFRLDRVSRQAGISMNDIPQIADMNLAVDGVNCSLIGSTGISARILVSGDAMAILSAMAKPSGGDAVFAMGSMLTD